MGRHDNVTAVVIFEAIAWTIFAAAALIGLISWLG
jgi:hypothetical protein